MAGPKRVVVLLSGSGSNLQALLDAAADPSFGIEVVAVASDRAGAYGLERARAAGVPALAVEPRSFPSREAFEAELHARVAGFTPDAVCLAGFMRILAPSFVHAYPDRIVNTHPSLLPAFRGAHAVREALAYGVRLTGCTVHLVDEEVDHGPVVAQAAVAVRDDDDERRLHERIKVMEHRLLPAVTRLVAHGQVAVEGRRVRLLEPLGVSGPELGA